MYVFHLHLYLGIIHLESTIWLGTVIYMLGIHQKNLNNNKKPCPNGVYIY